MLSDKELVTFDATQFARIDLHLQAIGNAIWAVNEQLKRADNKKLDAIIDMLQSQAGVAAELALVKAELGIIHGLIADLSSTDPEQLKQLTEQLKQSTDALDATVKANQPKQS